MSFARGLVLLFIAMPGVAAQEEQYGFQADQQYDTLGVFGTASETNPLLVYRAAFSLQMLDSSTVVYADIGRGRLVVVDLLTGEGWEVDDRGGEGPGEFGGRTPHVTANAGVVHTVTFKSQSAQYGRDGALLTADRFPPFTSSGETELPMGILSGGVLLTRFQAAPDLSKDGSQPLARRISAYAPGEARLWTYTDLPPGRAEVEGARVSIDTPDSELCGAARGRTIVLCENHGTWIVALNPDGSVRARGDLGHEAFRAFLDTEERVWVQSWTKNERRGASWIVLDSDLQPVMQVIEAGIADASGDFIVTLTQGPVGEMLMTWLRRKRD